MLQRNQDSIQLPTITPSPKQMAHQPQRQFRLHMKTPPAQDMQRVWSVCQEKFANLADFRKLTIEN